MEIIIITVSAIAAALIAYILKKSNSSTVKTSKNVNNTNDLKSRRQISFKDKYLDVGLPVITVKIINHEYDFILDTGANFNALDRDQFVRIIKENNIDVNLDSIMNQEGGSVVTGVGGIQNNIKEVGVSFSISDLGFNETFSLVNLSSALTQHGRGKHILCGVIGSSFFERNSWLIDFEELAVWVDNR